MERRPARHEEAGAGAGPEDRADSRSGIEEVLEVVEEEQELSPAKEPGQVVGCPDRLRNLGGQELGVREPRERHPEDAVMEPADELGGDLEREPGLSRPSGAGEREETRPVRELRNELLELLLAPDERCRDDGEVGCVERAERGKVPLAELEEAFCADQVLQPVLAEIADGCVGLEERARRLGENDLAAVGGAGDPRGAVDVDADVPLVRNDRLAGVDSHADPDRTPLKRAARLGGGRDRFGSSRERDEEGVALCVHLDAAMAYERLAECVSVLGEEDGVGRPVLLEQSRGALDVGEEERHRAARQFPCAHAPIIAQGGSKWWT